VTQQARNLSFTGLFQRMRFLIHDRDSKFTAAFDEIFRSEDITVIHTPIRAPQANAYAERFVRTIRAECLDWLLIVGRRHLEQVLRTYTAHYNRERPTVHSSCTRLNRPPRPTNRTPAESNAVTCSADSSTNTTEPQREPRFETPHRTIEPIIEPNLAGTTAIAEHLVRAAGLVLLGRDKRAIL
jgi:hypothetical protein